MDYKKGDRLDETPHFLSNQNEGIFPTFEKICS